MMGSLETKVVLKQTVLHGSSQPEVLQRVATVYIDGEEYRVSAPPEAEGDALDWVPHFKVRRPVDLNSEVEIHDALGILALKSVQEELEKRHRGAARLQSMEGAWSNVSTDIFVSHSSADAVIAEELTYLLRLAIPNLRPEQIRCTSVPGYRLEGGAKTDEQLLRELLGAKVFIGLLSELSLNSTYVLFELGARWGAGKHLLPLMVAGMAASKLRAPLNGLNAHSAAIESDLFQLVGEVAPKLGLQPAKPEVYQAHIKKLVHISQEEGGKRGDITSVNMATPSSQPMSSERPSRVSATTQRDMLADLISELEDNLDVAKAPRVGDAYVRPSSEVWESIRNKITLPDLLRSNLTAAYRLIDGWVAVVESRVHPNIGSPALNVATKALQGSLPGLIEELKKI
jgi:TIR domain